VLDALLKHIAPGDVEAEDPQWSPL
jgi:hypothetical protein